MLAKFSPKNLRAQNGRMRFKGAWEISLWGFLFFFGTPLSLILSGILHLVSNNSNMFFIYVATGVLIQLAFALRLIFRKRNDFIPLVLLYLLCERFADFKYPPFSILHDEDETAYKINGVTSLILVVLCLLSSLTGFNIFFILVPRLLSMLVAFVFKHIYSGYLIAGEAEENNNANEVNKYIVIKNKIYSNVDESFNKREVLKINNTIDLIDQIVNKLIIKKEDKAEIRNRDIYMDCIGFMNDLATLVEKYRSLGEFQDESVLDNVYEEALTFNKSASKKIEELSKEDVKALVNRTRLMLNAPNAMEMYDNRLFGLEPKEYAVNEIGDMFLEVVDDKKKEEDEEEEW